MINPAYMYLKSFNCAYTWSQKDKESEIKEEMVCDAILSTSEATELDLAKIFWSPKMYCQYFTLYQSRWFAYENSIKNWLLKETRKVKRNVMVRPTTLTDKLLYRNGFFVQKIQLFLKERLNNPKIFLNLKVKKITKSKVLHKTSKETLKTKSPIISNNKMANIDSMGKSDAKLSTDSTASNTKNCSKENLKDAAIKSPCLVKRSQIKLSNRKFSIKKVQIENSEKVLRKSKETKSKFVKEKTRKSKFSKSSPILKTDSKSVFRFEMSKFLKALPINDSKAKYFQKNIEEKLSKSKHTKVNLPKQLSLVRTSKEEVESMKVNWKLSDKYFPNVQSAKTSALTTNAENQASSTKSKSELIQMPIKFADRYPNKSVNKEKSETKTNENIKKTL